MPEAPKQEPKRLPAPRSRFQWDSLQTMGSNVLLIIALIILVVIVIWGFIHLLTLASPWFSSAFPRSTPSIEVQAPPQATSGAPFTVSWKYPQASGSGSYSFLYQCQSGLEFDAISGGSYAKIPCGASYKLGASASSLNILPKLSGGSALSVPISVVFASTGGAQAQGDAIVKVSPQGAAPAPAPATSTPSSGSGGVPHGSGAANLTVRIITVGVIDPGSGALINRAPTSPSDVVGVEFDIANTGGTATGSWNFEAHLPTVPDYTYTSPTQASLQPGAHVVNTLRFSNVPSQGGIFTVIVDPNNQITESTKADNTASANIY